MAAAKIGVSVRDVAPSDFITAYAEHLKRQGKMNVPEWTDIAKTASWKELGPNNDNWYYVRAASIARKVYLRGPTGVGTFSVIYGGPNKSRGGRPNHFGKGTRNVNRHILKQLQAIGVLERDEKDMRRISFEGQRDLDRIASTCVYGK